MENIFLTSSLQTVAKDLSRHIKKNTKKFLFITTASEAEEGDKWWLRMDRDSMTNLGYKLEDYTVTNQTKDQVAKKIDSADGVIMAGGNTIYLLQQIQQSKSVELFQKLVKAGKCYIGSSAGSLVAGPDVYAAREDKEIKKAPKIKGFNGLGLTDIIVQPHWGSDSFKDSYLGEILHHSYTTEFKQILLSDNQYLIVDDKNLQIIDVKKKNEQKYN